MERKRRKDKIWWYAIPCISIVLWGGLCITNHLWYDEVYSASLISHSWREIISLTAKDVHSPFYYFILKAFYHLCGGGQNFWSLKLLSLLFMAGYLLLGMFYVKKLFGEKISVYFLLFSMLMPSMAVQAGNVRMYAMSLFFMTLTGLSMVDLLQKSSLVKWIVFCLASVCTVYSHTFSAVQAFYLYVIFFFVILYRKKYHLLIGFFGSGFTVVISFLPWLVILYRQFRSRMLLNPVSSENASVPTLYTFMDYCKEWFSALETPISPVVFGGMVMTVFLGYCAVDWMRTHKNYAPGLGIAAIGATVLTGALVSLFITPCFLGRYVFPGFGMLAFFYAVGMAQISSRKIKAGILLLSGAMFLAQYWSELKLEFDSQLETYIAYMEENVGEDDFIMCTNEYSGLLSVYYPDAQYFIYGYKPENLPYQNMEAFTKWEQLKAAKGWFICFDGDDPSQLGTHYAWEKVMTFHHMYYEFSLFELIPLDGIFPEKGE